MLFQLLLALALTRVEPQTLQPPNLNRIEEIRVSGNLRLPKETIKYNLQTREGNQLDRITVRRDIKALYALGLFDDIRVEEEDGKTGKIVTFIVKERKLIRTVKYEGVKSISISEITDALKEHKAGVNQESIYDPTRIQKAAAVIKMLLAEKGHKDAIVTATTEDIPPGAIAITFKVDEGPKIRIQKITIQGNKALSSRQIKNAMQLVKESNPLTVFTRKDTYFDLKLADDIARIRMLYAEHGYVRANVVEPIVETKPHKVIRTLPLVRPSFPWGIPIPFWTKTPDRYYITIKIEENNQYRVGNVKVTGARLFSEPAIKGMLDMAPGEVFNEQRLRQSIENLKKQYGSRGYINFTAVPVQGFDEANKLINLNVNIEEDRRFYVNRISFTGNTTTRDRVIRREIMVNEGEVFNSMLWDTSMQRLNQLGYFDPIRPEDVELKPSATEPEVDINLKIKEKNRNQIGFSGGVSGIGGGFLGINYENNNFMGLGETLGVTLQGGTRQSLYQFSFTQPYLFDRPLTAGFTVFDTSLRYDQATEVFGLNPSQLPAGSGLQNALNFQQKSLGFNVFTSYPFKIWNRAGLNFGMNHSETSEINPATGDFFNAVITRNNQSLTSTSSGTNFADFYAHTLIPSYTFNHNQGNPAFPSGGSSLSTTFEYTGGLLGGNVNYYRPTLDFRYFHPMNQGRNVLAVRLLGSFVHGFQGTAVPYYQRFFAGGDFDIRGFDFRALSPIAFITRNPTSTDAPGNTVSQPFDDIVYVGGDTQGVANLEYRIPVAGHVLTLAPFFDLGNAWVLKRDQLTRQIINARGQLVKVPVMLLPGTNSSIRTSTGMELQILLPVINVPFRVIYAINPNRLDRSFVGPTTGSPFGIHEKFSEFKFTVGRTF
ncbi:MAG: outer membrane protein assembly factor BamA [Acidobacteria bacterium]|nr:MAG: outer membrane protein assembly factor BamA [Acidobacteriota bacterium]